MKIENQQADPNPPPRPPGESQEAIRLRQHINQLQARLEEQRTMLTQFVKLSGFPLSTKSQPSLSPDFRSIIENTSDIIARLDRQLKHIYINPAVEKATGIPAQAYLGKRHDELGYPPVVYQPWQKHLRAVFDTGQPAYVELSFPGPGGMTYYECKIVPEFDESGAVATVLTISRDLSQLHEYEKKLKLREQALQFLADTSKTLSASLEYETTLQTVAQQLVPHLADWCSVHILDEHDIPRQVALAHVDPAKIEWAKQLNQELQTSYPYQPEAPSGLPNVIRTGQSELYTTLTDEMMAAAAPDEHILELIRNIGFCSAMIVPLVARGRTLGAIQFVTTVESGYRYQPDDLNLAEELARRAALAVDNARLYQEAQQAIRLRDDFLSVAAHELKTPITSLKGHSQLIIHQFSKTGALDPPRVLRTLEVIDQQSDKLNYLVNQLLDVSRLESGRFQLTMQPTNLTELVELVAASARYSLANHKYKLEIKTAAPDGTVIAEVDPIRLEQVLNNLVNNAIKFSLPEGLIELEVSLLKEQGLARISVQDQGIGIAVENRERLFERFYQAHPGSYSGGMGLGLYISHQIVTRHEGTIQAEFPEQGGTRFVIRLPLRQPASAPAKS